MTKKQLTGVAPWLVGIVPMMILPKTFNYMTTQPSVDLCGKLTLGPIGAALVVFPNAWLCVLTASMMVIMKVRISIGTVHAPLVTLRLLSFFPKFTCQIFFDDWQYSFENVQLQNKSGYQ